MEDTVVEDDGSHPWKKLEVVITENHIAIGEEVIFERYLDGVRTASCQLLDGASAALASDKAALPQSSSSVPAAQHRRAETEVEETVEDDGSHPWKQKEVIITENHIIAIGEESIFERYVFKST